MGVRNVEEFDAFQMANELKVRIYRLVEVTPAAMRDWDFKRQLFDAASGVESCMGEGFARRSPAEFSRFLGYSLSSLKESELWLNDGVERGYFVPASIEPLIDLARRCRNAMRALQETQDRFKREDRSKRKPPPRPAPRQLPHLRKPNLPSE